MAGSRVAGAAGRMGCRLVALIKDSTLLTLAGAIEGKGHPVLGDDAGETAGCGRAGLPITDDFAALLDRGEVVVDFSAPEATLLHLRTVAHYRRAMVIGAQVLCVPGSLCDVPQHERGRQSDLQGYQRDGENAGGRLRY